MSYNKVMKTFKSYIVENRLTNHSDVVRAIAAYKKAGEIVNPEYKKLVDDAKHIMSYSMGGGSVPKPMGILELVRASHHNRDDDLQDLYYTSFDGFTSHKKIERLINKLDKKNIPAYKPMIKNVRAYLKDWMPVGQDLKALKSKVIKVTQKRAQAKAVAKQDMKKKFSDSSSLIKIFESHLGEYKKMAEQRAREFVKQRIETLQKHGMDLNKAAPSGYAQSARAKRAIFSSITKPKGVDSSRGENIREVDHAKIDRYVKMNVDGAEDAYRRFMQKMITKIGKPVIDAKMTGNIWTNAVLHVTTNDNEEQVWNTKMIINFSKYNKMFNQFPSRRKS